MACKNLYDHTGINGSIPFDAIGAGGSSFTAGMSTIAYQLFRFHCAGRDLETRVEPGKRPGFLTKPRIKQ